MISVASIGWIGSGLLAFCGLPQAVSSWRNKNSDGLTYLFLFMWSGGEIATLIFITSAITFEYSAPLLLNYSANLIFLAVIIWFKLFPKRQLLSNPIPADT